MLNMSAHVHFLKTKTSGLITNPQVRTVMPFIFCCVDLVRWVEGPLGGGPLERAPPWPLGEGALEEGPLGPLERAASGTLVEGSLGEGPLGMEARKRGTRAYRCVHRRPESMNFDPTHKYE